MSTEAAEVKQEEATSTAYVTSHKALLFGLALGPPGSGKSTVCSQFIDNGVCLCISGGELLRTAAAISSKQWSLG